MSLDEDGTGLLIHGNWHFLPNEVDSSVMWYLYIVDEKGIAFSPIGNIIYRRI